MLKTINFGIHFLLEICAVAAIVFWGFKTGTNGLAKILLGIAIPLLAMAIWGIFRVPNDPGPAAVAVPGIIRIGIELGLFAFSTWALVSSGKPTLAWIFGGITLLNYLLMLDRLTRLLNSSQ